MSMLGPAKMNQELKLMPVSWPYILHSAWTQHTAAALKRRWADCDYRPPRRSLENTVDDIGVPKYEPKSVRTRGETHPGRYPLPGSTRGHIPNGSSIGSCVLAQLTFVTDRETRKHTSYICSNRPHICAPFRHFEPSPHPLTVCSRTSSLLDTFAVRGPNHVIQTSK